jgi:hypothetical protein
MRRLDLSVTLSLGWSILAATSAFAQIRQDRPELCGRANETVALPAGTTLNAATGEFGLTLMDGSHKMIDLYPAEEILEVCPISRDRLLVFGTVAGGDGPHLWILSRVDGTVVDHIGSRSPSTSPHEHWIIYRQFYSRRTVYPNEHYLLYDLTKAPKENGFAGDDGPAGRQVYPVTAGGVPSDKIEFDEDKRHNFAGESFFWSSDGKFVMFADSLNRTKSIVLVETTGEHVRTYVHPIVNAEIECAGDLGDPVAYRRGLSLFKVEFGARVGALPEVLIYFSHGDEPGRLDRSCDQLLRLLPDSFKPAEIETQERRK